MSHSEPESSGDLLVVIGCSYYWSFSVEQHRHCKRGFRDEGTSLSYGNAGERTKMKKPTNLWMYIITDTGSNAIAKLSLIPVHPLPSPSWIDLWVRSADRSTPDIPHPQRHVKVSEHVFPSRPLPSASLPFALLSRAPYHTKDVRRIRNARLMRSVRLRSPCRAFEVCPRSHR